MSHLQTQTELDILSLGGLTRDDFGPDTKYPYLAFQIEDRPINHLAEWLHDLPCPVIGVGRGEIAEVCDVVVPDIEHLGIIAANIQKAPLASMILCQHLMISENQDIEDAITSESFAYSTIQNGPEFKHWLSNYEKPKTRTETISPPLKIRSSKGILSVTLNQPETRNAIDVAMRDALSEVFDLALLDTDLNGLKITAKGSTFSTGGSVEEFGEVSDPATAHWIRGLCLPAWRLARLKNYFKEGLHIHVNGPAIGAGAEIAAFGDHVTASSKAWFQLPELKYGLIPGAGGTASIPRRIGRQKTAYMALSMKKIRAETALKWGLIDAIID